MLVLGIVAPILILGASFALTRSTPKPTVAKSRPEPGSENVLLPEKKPSPPAATAQAAGDGSATDDSNKHAPSAMSEPLLTLEQWLSMTPDEVLTDNQVQIEAALTAAQWESVNAIADLGGVFMIFGTNDLFFLPGLSWPRLTFTKEVIVHLKRLDMIRTVRINRCDINEEVLAHFKDLIHIETLMLEDLPLPVTDSFLAHLGEMPKLRSLSIDTYSKDSKITDAGLAHLGRLSNLEVLIIRNSEGERNEIRDAGLQHLSGLTELKELCLAGANDSLTDSGLAHLLPLKKLTSLSLSSSITAVGMAQVGSFSKLTSLAIYSPHITDSGLARLSGLSHLTSLTIGCPGITDGGLATLPGLSNLEVLGLVGMPQVTDGSLVHLERCKGLKQLILSQTGVTKQGILKLREVLEECEVKKPGYDY